MTPNRKEDIVRNIPGSCQNCEKYKTCTDPCEDVQLWCEQDYIGRNSKLLLENGGNNSERYFFGADSFLDLVNSTQPPGYNERDSDESQKAWNDVSSMRLSGKVARFIYSYFMLGKRIRDIAIDEGATSQAIDQRRLQAERSVAGHIKRRSNWPVIRERLSYKSVSHYDISFLFFSEGYPRRSIAKLMGLHPSTVIKIISNQTRDLCPSGEKQT